MFSEVLQQALRSWLSESYIEISKVMEQAPEAQTRQSLWTLSCSVLRSELVAILEGLSSIESLSQLHDIWIFLDSRSAIQHLANWHYARHHTGTDILKILKRLSLSRQIPSHVNIARNEIADSLARAGETTTPSAPLTYLELFSKYKAKNLDDPTCASMVSEQMLLGSGQQ
ncbi:RNase H domain-containing protein [Trichonephila clavipes]|nr:RNase H domain-containing protein [Trichonephila clavipes]